jgi:4-amino-4-deoxy-L-arabinose transferase-like glycosyltransferase
MKAHQVFRQIQKRDTFLGLEIVDLLLLLVFVGVALMFTKRIVLVLIFATVVYIALVLLKRDKPDKHTFHLFQFYTTPRRRYPHPEEVE